MSADSGGLGAGMVRDGGAASGKGLGATALACRARRGGTRRALSRSSARGIQKRHGRAR